LDKLDPVIKAKRILEKKNIEKLSQTGPAWISTSIATPDVRVADVPPKGFDNQDIF
jgi:hypothetical protein